MFRFLLFDDVTFMSLGDSRMALTHSLTQPITRSIPINLFIKLALELYSLLPQILSIVFVQE